MVLRKPLGAFGVRTACKSQNHWVLFEKAMGLARKTIGCEEVRSRGGVSKFSAGVY